MSYSFSLTAASKAEAKAAASALIESQITPQRSHDCDREAIRSAVNAFIDALSNDEETNVFVSCNGSVGGHWGTGGHIEKVMHSTMTIRAELVAKPVEVTAPEVTFVVAAAPEATPGTPEAAPVAP